MPRVVLLAFGRHDTRQSDAGLAIIIAALHLVTSLAGRASSDGLQGPVSGASTCGSKLYPNALLPRRKVVNASGALGGVKGALAMAAAPADAPPLAVKVC